MTRNDGPEPVGSIAEEAARLFGVVSGWAREHGDDGSERTGLPAEELHEHPVTGSATCTWCPVCRTLAAVRHTSPEARAHLAGAASSFLLAVSAMMATPVPADAGGVERIDLDDEWPEDQG